MTPWVGKCYECSVQYDNEQQYLWRSYDCQVLVQPRSPLASIREICLAGTRRAALTGTSTGTSSANTSSPREAD
eukprot:scaffold235124_cov23-Prasinocladus_malaysianus.AAC.1